MRVQWLIADSSTSTASYVYHPSLMVYCMYSMGALTFHYFRWHYSRALLDLVGIIRNFLWFFYEFFSISLLLRTLFVPFHRLEDDRKKKNVLDFSAMAEVLLVNMLMRIVGALVRSFLIVFGTIFIVCTSVFGCFFLLVWLFAPLFFIFLVVAGITLLISG